MGLPQVPMPAAARGMPAPPAGAYYPEGAVPPGQQQQQQAPQPQQPAQPGPGGVVPAAGYQQQQPPYVPQQQPVYLDQNGQPIYYRVAPNQYDPYAGGAVAGTHVAQQPVPPQQRKGAVIGSAPTLSAEALALREEEQRRAAAAAAAAAAAPAPAAPVAVVKGGRVFGGKIRVPKPS